MAVAERLYARALFEAAEEQGRVDAVHRDLGEFADAVAGSPELASFLANPQVESAAKVGVLGELSDGADELVHNFLRLLAGKGRAGQIPGIRDEFQALVDRAQGRVAVELTTAFELSDDEAASIVGADRAGLRPHGRGNPQSRSRAGRRHDSAGRFAARRRQRARPPATSPPRARHPVTKEQT